MKHQLHYPKWLNKLFLFGLSIGLFMNFACWPTKKTVNLDELEEVIEMSKGPCFGTCPVFTLTIYEKGIAAYRGERFTERIGLYLKEIPQGKYDELVREFELANLWQFQDVYPSRIPDLATVKITFHEDGKSKSVTGKDGRPKAVEKLEQLLDGIVNSEGWEQKEKPESDLPAHVIPNELIVQLTENVDVHTWVRKYAKQNMQAVKSLSPNGYYWLVSFDDKIIPPRQMLEFVRNDPNVIGAEFNKKLGDRD